MAGRVKIVRLSFSGSQTSQLVALPDIPGEVVKVSRVSFAVESFSDATAIAIRLYHNIDLSVTLSFGDIPGNLWMNISQVGATGIGPPQSDIVYDDPYELIGPQRLDVFAGVGTVVGHLIIHYTLRSEPNRTIWNALRARTSREGG